MAKSEVDYIFDVSLVKFSKWFVPHWTHISDFLARKYIISTHQPTVYIMEYSDKLGLYDMWVGSEPTKNDLGKNELNEIVMERLESQEKRKEWQRVK